MDSLLGGSQSVSCRDNTIAQVTKSILYPPLGLAWLSWLTEAGARALQGTDLSSLKLTAPCKN